MKMPYEISLQFLKNTTYEKNPKRTIGALKNYTTPIIRSDNENGRSEHLKADLSLPPI
jgi:hypothetical protein